MMVHYLVVSALFVCIKTTHAQFFYSHYTPLTQIAPIFPQTFLPQISPITYANQPITTSTSSVTYNIPSAPSAEFRGFGYRTDYKDGASSTVFYVTGPEAQNLRSFQDFPNFTRKIQENIAGKARSLASDITDKNAIPDAQGKIQNLLKPEDFDNIFNNMPGVINFYNFPASTVPLALARKAIDGNVTTIVTSNEEPENVAAESVVNPKIVINQVDNMIKTVQTTSAASETTSESDDVTTVSSNSISVKSEEQTTTEYSSNNEDVTTVETTTQQ